jgi:hypothetical protein
MDNLFLTFLTVYYVPAYISLLIRSYLWRKYIKNQTGYVNKLDFYKAERTIYLSTVFLGIFIFLLREKTK